MEENLLERMVEHGKRMMDRAKKEGEAIREEKKEEATQEAIRKVSEKAP